MPNYKPMITEIKKLEMKWTHEFSGQNIVCDSAYLIAV